MIKINTINNPFKIWKEHFGFFTMIHFDIYLLKMFSTNLINKIRK